MQVVYKHEGRVTRDQYAECLLDLIAAINQQAQKEKRTVYWQTLTLSSGDVYYTGEGVYAWTLYLEVEAG